MFQSTRPHGARPEYGIKPDEYTLVSIHAPARGATQEFSCIIVNIQRFNPRARTGRDIVYLMLQD
ncbi:Uncharacterised protein [Legionella pneumophila]|nr:Uncharacterised protein [Legionella pneumophila]